MDGQKIHQLFSTCTFKLKTKTRTKAVKPDIKTKMHSHNIRDFENKLIIRAETSNTVDVQIINMK